MTIELPPEIEERLQGEASRRGVGVEELAAQLIVQHLSHGAEGALSGLFAQWAREDQTNDPDELKRRAQELEELKDAMNRNRQETDGPNTRTPFP